MRRNEKRKAEPILQVYEKLFSEIDLVISKMTLEETLFIPDDVIDLIEQKNGMFNKIAENFNKKKKNFPRMRFNTIRNNAYDEIRRLGMNIFYDEVCELLFEKYMIQLFQAAKEYQFITEMYGKMEVSSALIRAYSKIINKN